MGGLLSADVAAPSFWAYVAVAVVACNLAAGHSAWRWVLATVNLGFCLLVLGGGSASLLALSVSLVHGVGLLQRRGRVVAVVALTALAALLLLAFTWHKLPALPHAPVLLRSVLAGIGFSYVFLRSVDYLRAAAEGRMPVLSVADTLNYLLPFHMLAAGPIVAFSSFARSPGPTPAPGALGSFEAIELITRGLFKKFVLAEGVIAPIGLTGFRADGWYLLLEVQLYYLFIYLDFSAYSDIAVGIGRLLGVATPDNFRRPLTARNIIEFWERWHISLSQFIRRNVFLPIQMRALRATGGRYPLWVAGVAFAAAFLLCGLWHGLSPKFLLWGAMHATALIACNIYRHVLGRRLGRAGVAAYMAHPLWRVLATALTFEFVAFSLAFIAHPAFHALD